MRRTTSIVMAAAMAAAATTGSALAQPASAGRVPPAVFTDPDRRATLERAFPDIDALFAQFADRARVPGAAWGILIDGRLVHTGAVGVRDVAAQAPVDARTVFRIASMTKSFTAAAILKLRDEGRLSLDDPAEKFVPELGSLTYPTTDSPRITIRHLLSHAEGFPEDNPWGDRQLAATDGEMSAMLRAGIPFSTSPGTAYEYSNVGFAILGRIVAKASGQPYAAYIKSALLKPLGMNATTLDARAVDASHLAQGYRLEDRLWRPEPLLPDGAFGAMGGMLTSIDDLAIWVGQLMSAWPPRDDAETGPVRRRSLREMQQVARPAPATLTRDRVDRPLRMTSGGYGFGLRVWQSCTVSDTVAHSGGLPGFGSHMRWLPDHGVAIIALGNLTYTGWTRVVDDAIDALARTGGLRARQPQPSRALLEAQAAVSSLVEQWDDRLAAAIAADNLFLDRSKEQRRAELGVIHAAQGQCRTDGPIAAENALRGEWRMACDRGSLRVAVTLAPTSPPKVQSMSVRQVLPLDGRMVPVVGRVIEALNARSMDGVRDLLSPSADAAGLASQAAAMVAWGACRPAEVIDGDGVNVAQVRLACERGPVDLSVRIDSETRTVTQVVVAPVAGSGCVQ
jgi:CubicO group peptidase (beta-lactamase class C family)